MMFESIILVMVGGFLGVIGTVVGTLVNYRLRQEERKSDRRRELYERDLKIVGDSMHRVIEAMTRPFRLAEPKLSVEVIAQAHGMMLESKTVVDSFGDPELTERWRETMNNFETWWKVIDFDIETEVEFVERTMQTQKAASRTLRRIREILEEV